MNYIANGTHADLGRIRGPPQRMKRVHRTEAHCQKESIGGGASGGPGYRHPITTSAIDRFPAMIHENGQQPISKWRDINIFNRTSMYKNNKSAPLHHILPSKTLSPDQFASPGFQGDGSNYQRHLASELSRISEKSVHIHDESYLTLPPVSNYPRKRNRNSRTNVGRMALGESPESIKKEIIDIHRRHSMQQSANTYSSDRIIRTCTKRNSLGESTSQINGLLSSLATMALYNGHGFDPEMNQVPTLLCKDYVIMSRDHNMMRKYRAHPKNKSIEYQSTCVVCSKKGRHLEKVFFPCEHKCVCKHCLARQKFKKCPLCNEIVRIVLEHTGNEHEEYWSWVAEVSLSLLMPMHHYFQINNVA